MQDVDDTGERDERQQHAEEDHQGDTQRLRNAVTGGRRLSFQVLRPKGKPLELRALLRNGQDLLTEIWSYQLDA